MSDASGGVLQKACAHCKAMRTSWGGITTLQEYKYNQTPEGKRKQEEKRKEEEEKQKVRRQKLYASDIFNHMRTRVSMLTFCQQE